MIHNISTNQWHFTLKSEVYHYSDCLSNAQPVLDLIQEVNTVFQHISFDSELQIVRLGRVPPTRLTPTDKNWSKILAELREGKLATLLYGSLAANRNDWQVGFHFHLFNEQSRQHNPNLWLNYDSMGFWIEHTLLQEASVNPQMIWHLMERAWQLLHGVYGFADMFVTHRTGLVSSQEKYTTAHMVGAKVSGEHDSLKADPRISVPGAYWLNLLNARHIEALGGIDQIQASSRGIQIEQVGYGGASIQIAPSPIYDSAEDWQSDHITLERVFTPLMSR